MLTVGATVTLEGRNLGGEHAGLSCRLLEKWLECTSLESSGLMFFFDGAEQLVRLGHKSLDFYFFNQLMCTIDTTGHGNFCLSLCGLRFWHAGACSMIPDWISEDFLCFQAFGVLWFIE